MTFTKPTGTPIISAGVTAASSISDFSFMSAVGAFPIANIRGPSSDAAFSMLTVALVTPRSFASAATSGSAMKHAARLLWRSSAALFMPLLAILVSHTIVAPLCSAAKAACTAVSENCRFFS